MENTKKLDEIAREPIRIEDKTEVGEIFENLDSDKISNSTKMPSIDMNTRLTKLESRNMMIFDELKTMGIMPKSSNITMILKRLQVSLNGEGRREKVTIASASRSATLDGRSGGAGMFGRLFSPKP